MQFLDQYKFIYCKMAGFLGGGVGFKESKPSLSRLKWFEKNLRHASNSPPKEEVFLEDPKGAFPYGFLLTS